MTPIEQLKSVLCDPSGKCCIAGSDEDRAIVDRALQALAEQPVQQEPYCYTYTENGEEYFAPLKAYVPDDAKPLYTSPLAQRTWEEWFKWWRTSKVADSTEAEIDFADFMLIVRAVESEYGLKEKNT